MKVLITGSRHFSSRSTIRYWLTLFPIDLLIHGDCEGADRLAGEIAGELGIECAVYSADWHLGRKAGPIRNQLMIDSDPDLVIAFPLTDSKGTYDCICRAKKAGIAVLEIPTKEVMT